MRKAFTLVEIMIVIAVISIILAIAIPAMRRARESSRATMCQGNLMQIQAAKTQWAMEYKKNGEDMPIWDDIVGTALYLKDRPVCKGYQYVNGRATDGSLAYTINKVNADPTCEVGERKTRQWSHVIDRRYQEQDKRKK